MKRFLSTVVAALALAACADTEPTAVKGGRVEPAETPPVRSYTPQPGAIWTIFTSQTPADILDASPGWEVATRFYTSAPGCVTALRFYRAEGETGSNTIKLWTNSGQLLVSRTISSTTSGWKTARLVTLNSDDRVCLDVNTYYRVSVNTNTKQVKTFGYLQNGPIVNGPLTANFSYYGQPTGAMPTQGSYSTFFVDVRFEESY